MATAIRTSCKLDNGIKHVIYLQFDNTHLLRDRPNFASDLEQMPHLQNFLSDNGTLSDNEHTILISHTAGGILSSLTGLYPDRTGQAVSNSYGFFQSERERRLLVLVQVLDGHHRRRQPRHQSAHAARRHELNMVNGDSRHAKNTPAPWVPCTRGPAVTSGTSRPRTRCSSKIEVIQSSTSATGITSRPARTHANGFYADATDRPET